MLLQQFITIILMSLLSTSSSDTQSTGRPHDTCVYSFSVPRSTLSQSTGGACPGMTELEQQVNELRRTVRLQQEHIAAMTTQQSTVASDNSKSIAELTKLLQQVINSTQSGSTSSPVVNSDTWGPRATTYIRWGRTICPPHAQRLYAGYTAGTHFNREGGGANYLCLPETPEWTNTTANGFQSWSKIYGTEYQEFHSNLKFSRENNGGQGLHDHDVPCAACYVPHRSVQRMIPGKVNCPADWTLEYRGYIVSGSDDHKHQYIFECLDEAPEVVRGGAANADGALMYLTEVACGSLACPKYVEGWELSCVVCSK